MASKPTRSRPNAWRYRDYVIQSFNAGQAVRPVRQEQIAGDELVAGDPRGPAGHGVQPALPDESNARTCCSDGRRL